MKNKADSTFVPFNRDVARNTGYLYTTNARLSSVLANRRLTRIALELYEFRDKNVLDIGCGDGTYTFDLFKCGQPSKIHGIDPANQAIEIAQRKSPDPRITFSVSSAYDLPYEPNSFDVAHVRGVLHHLERPADALKEALRVAPTIIVIEPNGYNPVVKLLERYSHYHVEHEEKSYAPGQLDRWVKALGGRVESRRWVGLVPFFCPDWMAKLLKSTEPIVEHLPMANRALCGQYVFKALCK
jgi:SAM-dependent methyltransferase